MIQRFCKRLRVPLLIALILALSAAPALALNVPAWINNSKATIHTSTGQTGSLRAGTGVYVTAVKKGWAQINYKNHVGYIQLKYLTAAKGVTGYVVKSSYVYKTASTSSAKYGPLAVGTQLEVVGFDGDFLQVTNGNAYGYIPRSAMSKEKPSDAAILAAQVQLVDWNAGNRLLSRGENGYIYDIQSGLTVHVHRLGGTNHAELEPLTAEDTAKLLKMSGGAFSWDARPVILSAHGKMVVASINTMPQEDQTIKNNGFNGHFCMHFPGNRTHGTNAVNPNHQAAIQRAWAWVQSKR